MWNIFHEKQIAMRWEHFYRMNSIRELCKHRHSRIIFQVQESIANTSKHSQTINTLILWQHVRATHKRSTTQSVNIYRFFSSISSSSSLRLLFVCTSLEQNEFFKFFKWNGNRYRSNFSLSFRSDCCARVCVWPYLIRNGTESHIKASTNMSQ